MNENEPEADEMLVMTPRKRSENHTTIRMERVPRTQLNESSVRHVAGGEHHGIIINRQFDIVENGSGASPHLWLEFHVFLRSSGDVTTQESRELKFWFKEGVPDRERMHSAQDFFKELVSPCEFPRDYVGFIKKIMKLMQKKYPQMQKVECELKQLDTINQPIRPVSMDESMVNCRRELTADRVLEVIENSYPNPICLDEVAKTTQATEEEVHLFVMELVGRGVVRSLDNGLFVRITHDDKEVKLVRQMPTVVRQEQPTIAIITAQYGEKVAVDAMIENKNTFVKYKTEGGESNVYTLGNIGNHRVVSTKLPAVGHSRTAMIAAGNTTTRLLGTFQNVEYVILVGCGGGVPHYTDPSKHVRMGDIVVSAKPTDVENNNYIYMYAERLDEGDSVLPHKYNVKTWCPAEYKLQEVANELWQRGMYDTKCRSWETYLDAALEQLKEQDTAFERPDSNTDRLFMSIGEKEVIEVAHPSMVGGGGERSIRVPDRPVVHLGAVASGRMIMRDDAARHEFANEHGIRAFDSEFDTVIESIFGNRKEHYMFIRGISDYKDGTRKKEWQPYASLAAAAFMKSVICALQP